MDGWILQISVILYFGFVDRWELHLDSGVPKFFALGVSLSHFPRCSLCQLPSLSATILFYYFTYLPYYFFTAKLHSLFHF